MTSTSLLASAIVLPCSIAASTASRPSVPDDAQSTMSASGCDATATRPSRPAPASSTPSNGPDRAQPIDRLAGRHRGDARTVPRDLRGEQLVVLAGGEADHLQPVGVRVDDGERAPADRPGGSEDGDALHRLSRACDRARRTSARRSRSARRTAARRSGRARRRGRGSASSCPSRRRARFSIDSNRSPAMPSATIARPSSARQRRRHAGQPPGARRRPARPRRRRTRRSPLRPSSSG